MKSLACLQTPYSTAGFFSMEKALGPSHQELTGQAISGDNFSCNRMMGAGFWGTTVTVSEQPLAGIRIVESTQQHAAARIPVSLLATQRLRRFATAHKELAIAAAFLRKHKTVLN